MSGLIQAIRPLAWDFLPTIVFAALMALHVDVRIATAAAVGVGLAEVLIVKALRQQVPLLQWAGLGLALVFGTISIVTKDPRFVMVKPTLIYLAIGAVMLKRGWMLRYLPSDAGHHADDLMTRWGYVWAGLMAVTAVANLVFALWFTPQWPAFLAIFPLPSKLALFALQYASVRYIVTRRITAEMRAQGQAPAQVQAA
jgi:intracellular septation protein